MTHLRKSSAFYSKVMLDSKGSNPRDRTTNYFGEIKWFLRSMYTVNINEKGQVGEMIQLFTVTQ